MLNSSIVDWSTIEFNACVASLIASSSSLYQLYKAWKYNQNETAVDKTVADLIPPFHLQKKMLIGGFYDELQNKIIDGKIKYNISELSNMRYIDTFDATKIKTHSAHIYKTFSFVSKTGYELTANVQPLNIRHIAHHNPIQVATLCRQGNALHTNRAMKSVALSIAFLGVGYYAGHMHWKKYKIECARINSRNHNEQN